MICFPLRGGFPLPGGWVAARRLLAPARGAPRLLRLRPGSALGPGPLGVRTRPRHRHPSPIRAPCPRSLRRHSRPTRRADLSPRPKGGVLGGLNPPVPRVADLSGARGHPACASAPGDAGPERSAGNSEGHDAGAHCGVAGAGVCRRRARGRTSLQQATAAPAKQKPHAVNKKATATRGAREERGPGSPGPPQSSSTRSCDHRFMKTVVGSPDASSTTEAHTITPEPELTVTFA